MLEEINAYYVVRIPLRKKENKNKASNIENKGAKELLAIYLNRWIKLPTSSPDPRMRLFSVVVSFLLFALWQLPLSIKKLRIL